MGKKDKQENAENGAYASFIWQDRKRTFLGLPWSFTTYMLTESKFVTRTGFFNLTEDELDLYKITDKKLLLPFWQRVIGCGTIIIYVRDTDTPQKEVKCIKHPREVLAKLDRQIEAQRDRYNTRGRDLYGAGHPMPPHHCDHDHGGDNDDFDDTPHDHHGD